MKIEEIKSFLPQNEPFQKERIRIFFERNGKKITDENLNVRISRLKTKGIIVNISKGWYKVNNNKIFEPEINSYLKKISGMLQKEFPFLDFFVWKTFWLNELTTLQLMSNIFVIEVEAGTEDAVFRKIKDSLSHRIFLNPNENEWINYKADDKENIIIKTMITESPQKKYKNIKIARLEKILVDLYCDKFWKVMFLSEVDNIYREACGNFGINFNTLLRYAARRGKKEDIWNYIKSLDILDELTIKIIEK